MEPQAFLTPKDVCALIRMTRASLYRKMDDGTFPKPFYIGEHSPRWRADVVQAWMDDVSTARAA